jgi:hypothetical protein
MLRSVRPPTRPARSLAATLVAFILASCAWAEDLQHDGELQAGASEGCALDVTPPPARSQSAPDALKVLPPTQGAYLGTYQIPAWSRGISGFANATGRTPPIIFSFQDFFADTNRSTQPDQPFNAPMESGGVPPLELAAWLHERGSVLALAWSVYCCDIGATRFWLRLQRPHDHINRLLRGEHDDFLRDSARQIRYSGVPIMLTVVPEMDWQGQFLFGENGRSWMDSVDSLCGNYGDPAWPDGPERIRDLFIHVIDLFREEGAHNVTWFMYAGNNYMAPGTEGQSRWLHPRYYYPGDDYIDWVGQSVYFTKADWADRFKDTGTFDQVFLPGYRAWSEVTSRPLLLAEFGILAGVNDDRSQLWHEALGDRIPSLPGVKALTIADAELFEVYFDIPRLSNNPVEAGIVRGYATNDPHFAPTLRLGPN